MKKRNMLPLPTDSSSLVVVDVQEAREGLELFVRYEDGRTLTAKIPQDVAEIRSSNFTASRIYGDEKSVRIVYHGGGEEKVYETPIKR